MKIPVEMLCKVLALVIVFRKILIWSFWSLECTAYFFPFENWAYQNLGVTGFWISPCLREVPLQSTRDWSEEELERVMKLSLLKWQNNSIFDMKFHRQSVKFYSIIGDCKCFLVLIFIGVINGKFGNLSDPIAFGATLFGLEQKLLRLYLLWRSFL